MRTPPSATNSHCLDLIIIGGGVNGAGIARDAAGRGLKTALIEQADLAAATSSASTKLIHGGLRYLELFEFRLVREALIERERLLAIAPHIIHPMQFVLPHLAGVRPRWQIRAGLFLYDRLGGRKRLPASRPVRLTAERYGPLRPGLEHGFAYADCCVDDSRLVVLNALDAAERGAAIHTRVRFLSARVENGLWVAQCVSRRTGATFQLRGRALVNAAGPWVEQVLRSVSDMDVASQVRLVKGSHIVTPRLYRGDHAFMLQNVDGRIVFTIPYERQFTLIGTTDIPFRGDPAQAHISPEEVAYLCETVNAYFTTSISPQDVRWSYAGVRPLLDDESAEASKVTRDYRLELDRRRDGPVILSVFGGKITTYRRLAETALRKLHPHAGGDERGWTDRRALPGGDLPGADFEAFLAQMRRRWAFLTPQDARRLACAYGTRVERILGSAQRPEDLGEQFGAGLTQAEVEYLRANEWACSAEDILWRRTKLGLHMSAAERDRLRQALGEGPEPQPLAHIGQPT
ncbi:MAG TPA: glycerol-3-phosphate dehydrogenase [Steroidobacter sp.]|nr:glycerol-3-phosphate dehydrogenase [Steroidobacter sp.]